MSIEEHHDNHGDTPENLNRTRFQTTGKLTESLLELDKGKILEELRKAKNVEERVKIFSKLMDTYGLDFLIGLMPILGDFAPSIVATCYLIVEGINIGLSRQDCLKILKYQITDTLIGFVPIIGDGFDIFNKSNKKSYKIFSKHLEKLKNIALEKGVSQDEVDKILNGGKKLKNHLQKIK